VRLVLAAQIVLAGGFNPRLATPAAAADLSKVTVSFHSDDAKANVPDRFRLAPHEFPAEVTKHFDLTYSGVEVYDVRFPSPVASLHPENNTVYAEYFRPKGKGPFPAVVVLDILDGKQLVSRGEAMWLAQHDVAAMIVYMAYYGPRRPAGTRIRMLSPDVDKSVAAITQSVLDCRRAAAWLASRPELDPDRLGIVGTSLGSFVGGVAAAAEPRFKNVCLLLGGGGLVDAFYDHPKLAGFQALVRIVVGSKERLKKLIDPVDPLTYAEQLKGKRLLLIGASRDDVVPPAAMERLWAATGKPKILWVDATHVGAAFYTFPAMRAVVEHVKQK
jgi:dienelactone hydrolase